MKEVRKKIRDALRRHPEAFTSRQSLKNILNDCLPDKPLQNNLLMTAYDANIGSALRDNEILDTPLYNRLVKRIGDNFGIDEHRAGWAVINWFLIYSKKVLPEVRDTWEGNNTGNVTQSQPVKNPPKNNSYPTFGNSPDEYTPKNNSPVKSRGNKVAKTFDDNKMHLLETIYRANFNTPKWLFFAANNYYENIRLADYQITENMKAVALNLICHGRYKERDLIHLRISANLTHGWALTKDSFCIGGTIGNHIIKYENFDGMDAPVTFPVKEFHSDFGDGQGVHEIITVSTDSNNFFIHEKNGNSKKISDSPDSNIILNCAEPLENFLFAARNLFTGENISAKKSRTSNSNNLEVFFNSGNRLFDW